MLIAPLNWGLGHATRCIPIIDWFLENGSEVILASDGLALDLLTKEYPHLTCYSLPGYNITYARRLSGVKIASQALKINQAKKLEYQATQQIVNKELPDLIISDNRLGVRSSSVESIIVSHQIELISPIPFVGGIVKILNRSMINTFDECWIPDYVDSRLAGKLSKSSGINRVEYLGPISRFEKATTIGNQIVILLSGPEPQRTILEELIVNQLGMYARQSTLVRGTNNELLDIDYSDIAIVNLATSAELQNLMNKATLVISRTGYTTVMDLDKLGKKAILIPTPGQPEQEYLGKHLASHPLFTIIRQKELNAKLFSELTSLATC